MGPLALLLHATKIYTLSDKRAHRYAGCCKRFSIKVGIIFAGTKIPLQKWLFAILTSHRKDIASTQLARGIGVTQRTVWFMLYRLRQAAATKSFNKPLGGVIEADETFIGGKDRNKLVHKRSNRKGGVKTVVFGMLQRGGEFRAKPLKGGLKSVKGEIIAHVEQGATLITDDWTGYQSVDHHVIRHSADHSKHEHVRNYTIHTNGIESVWALLKRQIIGIHHHVSPKHLYRYLDEMTWRYNRSSAGEAMRFDALIAQSDGRLTYQGLVA